MNYNWKLLNHYNRSKNLFPLLCVKFTSGMDEFMMPGYFERSRGSTCHLWTRWISSLIAFSGMQRIKEKKLVRELEKSEFSPAAQRIQAMQSWRSSVTRMNNRSVPAAQSYCPVLLRIQSWVFKNNLGFDIYFKYNDNKLITIMSVQSQHTYK